MRREEEPSFEEGVWPSASPEVKALLRGMLAKNPGERLTLRQVEASEWMQRYAS